MKTYEKVPQALIDTVRVLSIDAVQKANSGHPGTPMGAAEMSLVLWSHFLRFHPEHPAWRDRDRFILSVGHASMLLYSLLHLFGYDCSLDDIRSFRQLGSRTAGHPEYGHLPGVEMTTGPLGQGVSSAVGFAMGQLLLAGKYNTPSHKIVTGRVWCLAGDGCLMEGVSSEAASLAGHLGLGNLTVIYDKNDVSIDGSTEITFTEDVAARYEAYGWHVIKAGAYDQASFAAALEASLHQARRPTLIIAQSVIGRGAATLEGSSATHGAALGAAEVDATKKKLGWTLPPFEVPGEARDWCSVRVADKMKAYDKWEKDLAAWRKAEPALAKDWDRQWAQETDEAFLLKAVEGMETEKAAGRKHGGKILNILAKEFPYLIGGSADLIESNGVMLKDSTVVRWSPRGVFEGRNIYFGVREHAMAAVVNGLSLHGAWRAYCSTFLQFADYMRPSIRLAALMKARSIFVFTHDSVFLGEDGPTHQPVEHLACLRMIPGLTVWRPGDGLETGMAWAWTMGAARGPVALCLSRQVLPLIRYPEGFDKKSVWKGGYVLAEDAAADLTLIATGSELGTAQEAIALMAKAGVRARLVSMPSVCVFKGQDAAYREQVLGRLPRVTFEAGATAYWPAVVGSDSLNIGVDGFGMSGPPDDLAKHFGLTAPQVAERILAWTGERAKARA
ncbi:MAG TPA: transketolase [bacterium]|jgi:transketolase|nr:transketolase [bacterium]